MRKLFVLLALLTAFGSLSSCTKPHHSTLRAHTAAVLKQLKQRWRETAAAVSIQQAGGQLSRPQKRADTQLTPWLSDRGTLYQGTTYHQTHYATLKNALIDSPLARWFFGPTQRKDPPHLLTVAQVNLSLKVLGAKSRITDLDDLIYLKDNQDQASQEPVGLLCEGRRLYVIQVSYYPLGKGAEISRGAVYRAPTARSNPLA